MSDPLMQRRDDSPPPAWSIFAAATPTITLARRSDPRTSHAAARSLESCERMNALLAIYREAGVRGLTAEEAGDSTQFDGAWKRVSDLQRLGMIVDSGATRVARSGRAQRVLVIAGLA